MAKEGPLAELPTPERSHDEAREAADEVLARPEYADARPGLVERVWEFLVDRFNEFLSLLAGGEAAGVVAFLVLLAATAAVLWLLVRAVRRVRRSGGLDGGPVTLEGRDAAGWEALAEAHEQDGQWRDALRCRYRAILATLVAAGRIAEVPGRTAREYLREARAGDPRLGEPLGEATSAFEQAWYAEADVGPADVRRLADLAAQVRALVAGQPREEELVAAGQR